MDERQLLEAKALVNIIFAVSDGQVLLPLKTKKIGVGLRNGYGGAVENGETMEESAIREFMTESKLKAKLEDLEKLGHVIFFNHLEDESVKVVRCQVFKIEKWEGKPETTDEMEDPQWFPIDQLPIDEMMVGDRYWVPQFLSNEANFAEVHYADKRTKLVEPVKLQKLPEAAFLL